MRWTREELVSAVLAARADLRSKCLREMRLCLTLYLVQALAYGWWAVCCLLTGEWLGAVALGLCFIFALLKAGIFAFLIR